MRDMYLIWEIVVLYHAICMAGHTFELLYSNIYFYEKKKQSTFNLISINQSINVYWRNTHVLPKVQRYSNTTIHYTHTHTSLKEHKAQYQQATA